MFEGIYRFLNEHSTQSKVTFNPDLIRLTKSISGLNFTRTLIVARFLELIPQYFKIGNVISVAIIGGGRTDPELLALQALGFELDVTTLGLEGSDLFLDLNSNSRLEQQFDLVVCSQVLEHVWNSSMAFDNLIFLAKKNGLIWVSVPASNRRHASPDYYSAGYSSEFLECNFGAKQVELKFSEEFGTKREYAARHLLTTWLTPKGHAFPLIFAFEGRTLIKRFFLTCYFLPTLLLLHCFSKTVHSKNNFSSETIFLGLKS